MTPKKITLTVNLLLISYLTMFSQKGVGINFGLPIVNISMEQPYNSISKRAIGFELGLIYSKKISSKIDFTSQLNINLKGTKVIGNLTFHDDLINRTDQREYNNIMRLTYLEIPLSINYFLFNNGLYLKGGGYFSYLLSGSYTINETFSYQIGDSPISNIGSGSINSYTNSIKNKIRNIDAGVLIGIGFEKKILKLNKYFFIELSYSQGLIDLANSTDSVLLKNNSININLGVLFGRKKSA